MDNGSRSSEKRDIVVVGASAGGIEAARELVAGLSPELPAAVLVVVHVPPDHPSILPKLLATRGPLPATHARDREPIAAGHVYVAPPGRHLVVMDSHMRLMSTASENLHRPAIDPLFRSAASAFGPRVIGVVLSGALDDGTAGLEAIKASGGTTVAQDPADAAFPSMPESAIANVGVAHVAPARELGGLITRLVDEEVEAMPANPEDGHRTNGDEHRHALARQRNSAASYSCPDCGGVLTEVEEGGLMHFRCRVGHAFSPETLATYQAATIEKALWTALRAMDENAEVWNRMAARAAAQGRNAMLRRYEEKAQEIYDAMDALNALLLNASSAAGAAAVETAPS